MRVMASLTIGGKVAFIVCGSIISVSYTHLHVRIHGDTAGPYGFMGVLDIFLLVGKEIVCLLYTSAFDAFKRIHPAQKALKALHPRLSPLWHAPLYAL